MSKFVKFTIPDNRSVWMAVHTIRSFMEDVHPEYETCTRILDDKGGKYFVVETPEQVLAALNEVGR